MRFYEHERRIAQSDIDRTNDAAARHHLIGKREHYTALVGKELAAARAV